MVELAIDRQRLVAPERTEDRLHRKHILLEPWAGVLEVRAVAACDVGADLCAEP